MTLLDENREAAAVESVIAQVWSRTRGAALERVATIESGLVALRCGALDVEARLEAQRAAHRLAGSAGTFGFARASEAARRLEMTIAGNGPVPASRARRRYRGPRRPARQSRGRPGLALRA